MSTARDYPAILAMGGLTDPRVTYWEPAKWIARLRATMTSGGPVLLRTNMGAGHGGASGRFDRLDEVAIGYAFALWAVGLADKARNSVSCPGRGAACKCRFSRAGAHPRGVAAGSAAHHAAKCGALHCIRGSLSPQQAVALDNAGSKQDEGFRWPCSANVQLTPPLHDPARCYIRGSRSAGTAASSDTTGCRRGRAASDSRAQTAAAARRAVRARQRDERRWCPP